MHATRRHRFLPACLALAVLLAGCTSTADGGNSSTGAAHGTPAAAALDEAVAAALDGTGVPGAAVLVTHSDGTEELALYGETAPGSATAADSKFAYRSITKSFIGTVILQLVDEGLLRLDSPPAEYLSELPIDQTLTIAELGTMRSGIANYSAMPQFGELLSADPGRKVPVSELLELPLSAPMEFPPGSAYEYSNTNTLLLGEIIEQVTGEPWLAAVESRIRTPLGLTSIAYGFQDPDHDATGFQVAGPDSQEALSTVAPEWFGAAGGLTGDIHDLAAWGAELGRGTTLQPETQQQRIALLGSTADDPNSPSYDRYGFAMGEIDGWIGHTGNGLGFQSLVMYHPEQETTVAILINGTGEDPDLPAGIFRSLLKLL